MRREEEMRAKSLQTPRVSAGELLFSVLLTEQSWEASQATAWVTYPCSFTDTNGALVPCCLAGCWGQRSSVSREPLLKAWGSGVSSSPLLAFLRGGSHFRSFSS